jgi:uncharacterized membrane protein
MLGNLFYVLHVLGAVLWVGGMAFALFAMRPALLALEPAQRQEAHLDALGRFFRIVWHAMPILLVTGYLLLFGWYGGFRGSGWHVHAMHLMGLVMAGIFLTIVFGPWKEFRAAMATSDRQGAGAALEKIRQLVQLNLILGLLTVAVAAWGRFPG